MRRSLMTSTPSRTRRRANPRRGRPTAGSRGEEEFGRVAGSGRGEGGGGGPPEGGLVGEEADGAEARADPGVERGRVDQDRPVDDQLAGPADHERDRAAGGRRRPIRQRQAPADPPGPQG